jgi:hypothetical protein
VFDWKFGARPNTPREGLARWGGYRAEFKVIERDLARSLADDLNALRRQSVELGPEHQRVFQMDISKFEFCRGSATVDVDHYRLQVYTPAMIAAEINTVLQQGVQAKHWTSPVLGVPTINTTTKTIYVAQGSTNTATWIDTADGTTTITPA